MKKIQKALERLLDAAEGFDSLYDDESRAEAYRDELRELSKAKDQARAALVDAYGKDTSIHNKRKDTK